MNYWYTMMRTDKAWKVLFEIFCLGESIKPPSPFLVCLLPQFIISNQIWKGIISQLIIDSERYSWWSSLTH